MKSILFAAVLFLSSNYVGAATPTSKVTYSGFDNAKIVSVQAYGNSCKNFVCTGIGAYWNSSIADSVLIKIGVFNLLTNISEAELSIDGKKVSLKESKTTTDFLTLGAIRESTRSFEAPYSLIKEILSAKRVWLRVHTPTGSLEDPILENSNESMGFKALLNFDETVKIESGK